MITITHIPEQQEHFERFMSDYKDLATHCSMPLSVIENGPKNTRTLNVCKEHGASYAHTGQREESPSFARNVAVVLASRIHQGAFLIDSCIQLLDSQWPTLNEWLKKYGSKHILGLSDVRASEGELTTSNFFGGACYIPPSVSSKVGLFSRKYCGRWGHDDLDFACRASYLKVELVLIEGISFKRHPLPQLPPSIKEEVSRQRLGWNCMQYMAAAVDRDVTNFKVDTGDLSDVKWTWEAE